MTNKGRMTAGPWTVRGSYLVVDSEDHPISDTQHCQGKLEDAANARAIACLPELVEAARRAYDILINAFAGDPTARDLRRILARIDGGD